MIHTGSLRHQRHRFVAKRKSALSPDEERFVEEYLIDRNGTAAYMRANPETKRRTAGELAYRLLKKVVIRKAIASGSKAIGKACRVSAQTEVRGLAMLANYDIGAAFDLSKDGWVPLPPRLIPYEVRQAIVGVKIRRRPGDDGGEVETVEIKFADKIAARDKLMRHLGLYQDLPPLEVLLSALPEGVAETVRAALAQTVHAGRGAGGDQPAPVAARGGGAGSTPGGPNSTDEGGGTGPGPVAGGVDSLPGSAGSGPLHPPVGEDEDGGGEGDGPFTN
jgi:phage terminase small subunit